MIRVALFFIAVALAALGVAWFADRPGEVAIVWNGWVVETSVMVGAVAILVSGRGADPRLEFAAWRDQRTAPSTGLLAAPAQHARVYPPFLAD